MKTSQSGRRRGRKSGYEISQKDDWVEAPKAKSKSKEIKQKGIMEKGPRVQDDVISVAENLIEEIILQDKCHKTKYVDNNPQPSTSQIEQEQKPNLNQQNTEKTDLYAERGSCFMDMSSTTSCPPDVSIQQSTKQNLLVEGPTPDGITSPNEDPINENPPMGKTSQDNYPISKSINSNQSSTTEEVVLEIPVTSQNSTDVKSKSTKE